MSVGNYRGQTLLSIVMASTVGLISLFALFHAIAAQTRATRGIASNLDLSEISLLVHILTDSPAACAKSGLLNVNTSPLFASPPVAVPVVLKMENTASVLANPIPSVSHVAVGAGVTFGGSRKINSFDIVALSPNGGSNWVGTLKLRTALMGKAMTQRPPDQSYFLNLELDSNRIITACSRGGSLPTSPSPTPAPSPTPSSDPCDDVTTTATCPSYVLSEIPGYPGAISTTFEFFISTSSRFGGVKGKDRTGGGSAIIGSSVCYELFTVGSGSFGGEKGACFVPKGP